MGNILEITGDDIAKLNDEELRQLTGLLCEADYRAASLSTRGIRWSGNQNAKDGGVDVVSEEIPPPPNSYVKKSLTRFQVKKSKMRPCDIIEEMRPNGVLRPKILELINSKGAYIIVSSGTNAADPSYDSLIQAMKETVANEDVAGNIVLDFYDQGRIATWVRNHPSLIIWVRDRIKAGLFGWKPYANWANPAGDIDEEYVIDEKYKLKHLLSDNPNKTNMDVLEEIRTNLKIPGKSIRLIGLSGVGKTRLVQAFFDEKVGNQALNKYDVCYTDTSFDPDPKPSHFAEQLIAHNSKSIMIVDNCSPDLHRALTKTITTGENRTVSLLTVEYDVQEDIPEETDFYKLEPASIEVVFAILKKRFPQLKQEICNKIADVSGGNARLAIAISGTVREGDILSGLKDKDLFNRLFWQRENPSNKDLLISGEILSLVYSFNGTDIDSGKSELRFLASLADKSPKSLYRDIATLMKRDLIQSRGEWKALLPHFLANYLAEKALENIPEDVIFDAFENRCSWRLLISFSKRLSHMSYSQKAQEIAGRWLAPDGWLGNDLSNLSTDTFNVFKNIASISPEKTLEAIEYNADKQNPYILSDGSSTHRKEMIRLLWHIAYDPKLFARSVKLLCRFVLMEKPNSIIGDHYSILTSLFYIYMSGTKASPEQRAGVVRNILTSTRIEEKLLGVQLIDATLKTEFPSRIDFDFGSRIRGQGYTPKNIEELRNWYNLFINILTDVTTLDEQISMELRKVLADNLCRLCSIYGVLDILEEAAKKLHQKKAWVEGWLAVRHRIRIDNANTEKSYLSPKSENYFPRLHKLEEALQPISLEEKALAYSLSKDSDILALVDFDTNDNTKSTRMRVEKATYEIGVQLGKEIESLRKILPDLVYDNKNSPPRILILGKGIAEGCAEIEQIWDMMCNQLAEVPEENRLKGLLFGFLSRIAEKNRPMFDSILKSMYGNELFQKTILIYETSAEMNKDAVERVLNYLDSDIIDIRTLWNVSTSITAESVSDDDLAEIINKIIKKDGGFNVAVDMIEMRIDLFPDKTAEDYSKRFVSIIHSILSEYPFASDTGQYGRGAERLDGCVRLFLKDEEGTAIAKKLCHNLLERYINHRSYLLSYSDLLRSLIETQPLVFLDTFIGEENEHYWEISYIMSIKKGSVDCVPIDSIVQWANKNPELRYSRIAELIAPVLVSQETGKYVFTQIANAVLENAPDINIILNEFSDTLRPMSFNGTRSSAFKRRLELLEGLANHPNEIIKKWVKEVHSRFEEEIIYYDEKDDKNYRKSALTFEPDNTW